MNRAFGNALRFFAVYSSLIRNLFRFSPKWTIAIMVFQVVGPALQGLIILVLHNAVGFISGEDNSRFGAVTAHLSPRLTLAAISLLVILLGVGGAYLGWLGASGARKLGRRYRIFLTGTVFERISEAEPGNLRIPGRFADESHLAKMSVKYGLKLNLATMSLFVALRHFASVVILAAILVTVNPTLAGFFFLVAPVVLPVYYILHRKTHDSSRQWFMEGGARETAAKLIAHGREANLIPTKKGSPVPVVRLVDLQQNEMINENLMRMEYGRLSSARSQMYSGSFRALFLGIALFVLGIFAGEQGQLSWDNVIVFLIAAAMLQQSVTGLLSSLSTLVWHSPMIAASTDFSGLVFQAEEPGKAGHSSGNKANPREMHLREKGVALVVSPVRLGKTSFHFLIRNLYRQGIVEALPRDLNFHYAALSDLPNEAEMPSDPDRTLLFHLDQRNSSEEKILEFLGRAAFSRAVVFAEAWSGELDRFDQIVRIEDDGFSEKGDAAFWKGREEELKRNVQSGGADLDDEDFE